LQEIITLDVFNENGGFCGQKNFYNFKNAKRINEWLLSHTKQNQDSDKKGVLMADSPDFQHNNHIAIVNESSKAHLIFQNITAQNVMYIAIYFSVRHCINASWLNDRDQFLHPDDKWKNDKEFHADCLAFMLFHNQNRISSNEGINHFIPFTEREIGSKEAFQSDFMVKFINGKFSQNINDKALFSNDFIDFIPRTPISFSIESKAVFDAGKEVYAYYHTKAIDKRYKAYLNAKREGKISPCNSYNPNASLYEIKAFFKGRKIDKNGKDGNIAQRSDDSHFNDLMANLASALETLAKKIESKVYEYEFLLR